MFWIFYLNFWLFCLLACLCWVSPICHYWDAQLPEWAFTVTFQPDVENFITIFSEMSAISCKWRITHLCKLLQFWGLPIFPQFLHPCLQHHRLVLQTFQCLESQQSGVWYLQVLLIFHQPLKHSSWMQERKKKVKKIT